MGLSWVVLVAYMVSLKSQLLWQPLLGVEVVVYSPHPWTWWGSGLEYSSELVVVGAPRPGWLEGVGVLMQGVLSAGVLEVPGWVAVDAHRPSLGDCSQKETLAGVAF